MRKMNERAAGLGKSVMVVLLAAVLVAVGVVLATCNVTGFDDGGGATDVKTDDASSPLPGGLEDGGVVEGGTSEADADGKATLSMTFRWGSGSVEQARSVVGADGDQIEGGVGTLRNFFQMILVDKAAPDQVWDFDEEESTAEAQRPTLTAGFLTGHTYSILILMGHDAGDGKPPTLLASGFLEQKLEAGENKLEMPLVPIVVGAKFVHYAAPSDVRQVGRLARTVGLDAGKPYTLVYTLGSKAEYAGGRPGDALREVTGDGVAPLRSADKAVYHGIDDWVPPNGLRLVANFAVYSLAPTDALSDWYDKHGGHSTNGVATYTLEAGQANAVAGSVFFNMVYAPFGLDKLDNWKDRDKFSHIISAATDDELPRWVIRNGLSDAPQTAAVYNTDGTVADYGTDFARYGKSGLQSGATAPNANGAISVGVVDPAAVRAGLFEDNNPWPIAGTEDKTSVEILAWLTASPITTVKTLAGIQGEGTGKYGVYTLRPEHYYAAPLSGGNPVVTGTAANGGASWQDACSNIQKLVDLARVNYELTGQYLDIWAAAGTYTASVGSGTVIDINGGTGATRIYGGFKGTETAAIGSLPAGRDGWFKTYAALASGNEYGTVADSARETILDAGGNGAAVKVNGAANLVLDGFTITDGADSGLWIEDVPATSLFKNLDVTGNTGNAGNTSGGISVLNGAPKLENLTVTGNTSNYEWGGGITITTSAAHITNAFVSNNETVDCGGGIAIADANPRLENIVVTGNKTKINGGGIYMHGSGQVIVNALVLGNTCDVVGTGADAYSLGGSGIYVGPSFGGAGATIVNALVSGNRMTVSAPPVDYQNMIGGGGIKVNGNLAVLTLINSTVSGNYASHPSDFSPRGGGIMVVKNPSDYPATLHLYNSIVAGNTGQGVEDDDLTVAPGNKLGVNVYTANNSLVGGWNMTTVRGINLYNAVYSYLISIVSVYDTSHPTASAAAAALAALQAGKTVDEITDIASASYGSTSPVDRDVLRSTIVAVLAAPPYGGPDGASYGAMQAGLAIRLNNGLFAAFPALPTEANTGVGYNAAAWNFRLGNSPPAGVINGGDAAYYNLVPGDAVVPRISNMGAY